MKEGSGKWRKKQRPGEHLGLRYNSGLSISGVMRGGQRDHVALVIPQREKRNVKMAYYLRRRVHVKTEKKFRERSKRSKTKMGARMLLTGDSELLAINTSDGLAQEGTRKKGHERKR